MSSLKASAPAVPTIGRTPTASESAPRRSRAGSLGPIPWVIVALAVVLISSLFVVLAGIRPEFDAYGWLVWGHQGLHGNLDTNAAPSWKPLTFLFTFVYALAGSGELWLWMVTAVAVSLAGAIFAGRIAYRLAGPAPGRGYARIVAAAFAGLGVLGLVGYGHLILIAASDPMDVTLFLAAIDCHLSGRPRAAWVLLVLLALGRPEAGVVAILYAGWAWRAAPAMRAQLVAGVLVLPLLWFGIAALTSRSWFIASDIAIQSTKTMAGTPLSRIPHNFLSLYEVPMKLAVLFALTLAVVRRERTWLLLAGAALVWLATWVAFALHGWNPSPRYLFEAAAVLIVLVGAAVGWVLANAPRHTVWRWAAVAGVIALVVALAAPAQNRVRLAHNGIVYGQRWARQLASLNTVIDKAGAKRILACGQPASYIGFQTILAWDLDRNVADIGYLPGAATQPGPPVVLFKPKGVGWKLVPLRVSGRGCRGLARTASS